MQSQPQISEPPAMELRRHLHYKVYGQHLCSSLELPALTTAVFNARDLQFHHFPPQEYGVDSRGQLIAHLSTDIGCDLNVFHEEYGYLLRWEGRCDFVVSEDGKTITAHPLAGTSSHWVQCMIYGMILSFALHLRNIGNLHGSAVEIDGHAVAFLAEPGTGKSTLAARLAKSGHTIFTDDVVVLIRNENGYELQPGFPHMSLSAESLKSVVGMDNPGGRYPLIGDKYRIPIDGTWAQFATEPKPISAIFHIERDERNVGVEVTRVSTVEAIGLLTHNTLCLPFLPSSAVATHLKFAKEISQVVPIYRLSYAGGWRQLADVRRAVTDAVHSEAGGTQ